MNNNSNNNLKKEIPLIKNPLNNLPFNKTHNPLKLYGNYKYSNSFKFNINFFKKIHEILIEYINEKKIIKVYWKSKSGTNMQATISSTILSETNLNNKNNKNIMLIITLPVIDIFNEKTMNIIHDKIMRIPIDAENLKIGSVPFFDFIQQQIKDKENKENLYS